MGLPHTFSRLSPESVILLRACSSLLRAKKLNFWISVWVQSCTVEVGPYPGILQDYTRAVIIKIVIVLSVLCCICRSPNFSLLQV